MPNNVSDKIQLNFDYIHGGITCIEKGYDSEMRKYPFYVLTIPNVPVFLEKDGKTTPFPMDTALLIPPGVQHRLYMHERKGAFAVWCHFQVTIYSFFDYLSLFELPETFRGESAEKLRSMIRGFLTTQPDTFYRNILHLKANGLMLTNEIVKRVASRKEAPERLEGLLRLHPALEYMQKNLHHKIKLEDVAKQVYLSKSRFMALFKEVMSISPGEYHCRMRLNAAYSMLTLENYTTAQVAQELQFYDVFHFMRQFKRQFGITPAALRNQSRIDSKK